jgi:hypothetical protein
LEAGQFASGSIRPGEKEPENSGGSGIQGHAISAMNRRAIRAESSAIQQKIMQRRPAEVTPQA